MINIPNVFPTILILILLWKNMHLNAWIQKKYHFVANCPSVIIGRQIPSKRLILII